MRQIADIAARLHGNLAPRACLKQAWQKLVARADDVPPFLIAGRKLEPHAIDNPILRLRADTRMYPAHSLQEAIAVNAALDVHLLDHLKEIGGIAQQDR